LNFCSEKKKKSTRRHLDFWPPFWIFLQPFIFFKKYEYFFYKNHFTEWKNLYSLIFAKFLKIKSQKSAILDCAAILKDFQKRFSTKCYFYLALQNVEEIFENMYF
jgi:hypothetical protein